MIAGAMPLPEKVKPRTSMMTTIHGPRNGRSGSIPIRTTAAGIGITSALANRKGDSNIVHSTDAKDGKVYETGHIVVSADVKKRDARPEGETCGGRRSDLLIDIRRRPSSMPME